jgi:hypothetical protein
MHNDRGVPGHDGERFGTEIGSKEMKMQDVIVPTSQKLPEVGKKQGWKLPGREGMNWHAGLFECRCINTLAVHSGNFREIPQAIMVPDKIE